jgi:hypothetical protein
MPLGINRRPEQGPKRTPQYPAAHIDRGLARLLRSGLAGPRAASEPRDLGSRRRPAVDPSTLVGAAAHPDAAGGPPGPQQQHNIPSTQGEPLRRTIYFTMLAVGEGETTTGSRYEHGYPRAPP